MLPAAPHCRALPEHTGHPGQAVGHPRRTYWRWSHPLASNSAACNDSPTAPRRHTSSHYSWSALTPRFDPRAELRARARRLRPTATCASSGAAFVIKTGAVFSIGINRVNCRANDGPSRPKRKSSVTATLNFSNNASRRHTQLLCRPNNCAAATCVMPSSRTKPCTTHASSNSRTGRWSRFRLRMAAFAVGSARPPPGRARSSSSSRLPAVPPPNA